MAGLCEGGNEPPGSLKAILNSIKRRRLRKSEEDATFHDNSYGYKVRVKREDAVTEVPVCSKAFVSVRGITKKRREVIQRYRYLKERVSPKDRRGPLPVSKEKYKDLQQLKKFCGEEARGFYEKLPRKD
ncbi:hypothetical protein ANN_01589 [Periplaneta americana]|uniref:Uncharacterized protein n=1 Tax=Periplaneta americana TaxID=6978 RepID=A0ABQ8TWX0_PERAM|nr:hypothetical protein ANN_01589 [Periplaneta americana]